MKVIKGISLFFVYPMMMLLLGFWCGVKTEHFFYPGEVVGNSVGENDEIQEAIEPSGTENLEDVVAVSVGGETLCADTVYVLEEVDILKETSVETTRNLPAQYLGMNRDQFMMAMENYQSAPPLTEQERGFESLEVLSFSREQVKVRMNYRYVQPGQGFYLVVEDHEVVVYLEDKETVYINTGIKLETLPEDLQLKIMQMHYVEGEGNLYNFLETYSS